MHTKPVPITEAMRRLLEAMPKDLFKDATANSLASAMLPSASKSRGRVSASLRCRTTIWSWPRKPCA